MRRHEARRCALQALYQVDVGKAAPDEAVSHVLEEAGQATPADQAYVQRLVRGTRSNVERIDQLLAAHVQGWRLDRIAKVELNILRLALYELLNERDVDVPTVIDEAVELAKAFGTEASGKFVNGVLARVLPAVEQARR
ncbi:MAG: transcription antitermination factor NusB [Alicyclobacillaceae bacterium]|nr:transcription antitermination factor NusB [Alicyclobacillaceae bacterium]